MTKTEFNQIRDALLEGYRFDLASDIIKMLEKKIGSYACPPDITPRALKQDVKEMLDDLYKNELFGKSDCSSMTGRFEVAYYHKDSDAYDIEIHLMPLEGSYGLASDGSFGFDFE